MNGCDCPVADDAAFTPPPVFDQRAPEDLSPVFDQRAPEDLSPVFDQRPGEFEATRGLMGGRHAMLIGSRHDDGWRAMVYAPRALDAAEMRDLAKRLDLMAAYFEGLGGW